MPISQRWPLPWRSFMEAHRHKARRTLSGLKDRFGGLQGAHPRLQAPRGRKGICRRREVHYIYPNYPWIYRAIPRALLETAGGSHLEIRAAPTR